MAGSRACTNGKCTVLAIVEINRYSKFTTKEVIMSFFKIFLSVIIVSKILCSSAIAASEDEKYLGFTRSVDAEGRVTLTKIAPSRTIQRPTPSSVGDAAITNPDVPDPSTLLKNIRKQLDIVSREPDQTKAAQILMSVRGAIGAAKARFYKQAQDDTYREFQVPQLTQQLRESERLDRATPGWNTYRADTTETASVRATLIDHKIAASNAVQSRLNGNPEYGRFIAEAEQMAVAMERMVFSKKPIGTSGSTAPSGQVNR